MRVSWLVALGCCTPAATPVAVAPVASSADIPADVGAAAPRAHAPPRIARIAVGAVAGCALFDNGTVRCWGWRYYPLYGDVIDEEQARSDAAVEIAHLTGVTAIAVGRSYLCAITGGPLLCWGNNGSGQLAQAGTAPRYRPTRVAGVDDATALALAPDAACMLRGGGAVWCWGSNFYGELGDGTHESRHRPAPVVELAAVSMAIGHTHACAVLRDKSVRCWGDNDRGQLGDGTTRERLVPTPVRDVAGAAELALGDAVEVPVESRMASEHSCARIEDGTVRCWGDNRFGQLGIAALRQRPLAQAVPDLRGARQIAAGTGHTCARIQDGKVRCWGRNRDGELGDGTSKTRVGPVTVLGVEDAVDIASGGLQTCALTKAGEVQCWGARDGLWRVAGL